MSTLKNKKFIITRETGLWDTDKYISRIKTEKKYTYKWPGDLPSDKQQKLPYKTHTDECIKRLMPGEEITVHEVLYDAERTYRPGRFQCLDATAHLDSGDKKGFIWTIYEGKTYIAPKIITYDKEYSFKVLKKQSKQNWIEIELMHDLSLPESWDDSCLLYTTEDNGETYKQEVSFLDNTCSVIHENTITAIFTDLIPNKKYSCRIKLGKESNGFSNQYINCFNDFKISKQMIHKNSG